MIKVYLAGPYSDDNVLGVLKNIGRGQYYSSILFGLGFAPFVPWFDREFIISQFDKRFDVSQFYNYSIEWLNVSDCVFVVPNHKGLKRWEDSSGTKLEITIANKQNKPVFYNIKDIISYYKNDDLTE